MTLESKIKPGDDLSLINVPFDIKLLKLEIKHVNERLNYEVKKFNIFAILILLLIFVCALNCVYMN